MIYYDATNLTGISQEIDSLCDSTDTSYPVGDKERRINTAVRETEGLIMGFDGSWDYDGTNQTNLPIATTNLAAGQQDYTLSGNFLEIKAVRVLDSEGNWVKLVPFDKSEVGIAVDELFKTDGMPRYYDKQGSSIFLYPAPAIANVTATAGLKVDFSRLSSLITDLSGTDATKEPGFAPYDMIIAYKSAIPYCITYKQDRVGAYLNEIFRLEDLLKKHYGRRNADVKRRIVAVSVNAN